MIDERRRSTDPLIQELIDEVKGFREDLKPIREFMEDVNAAKKAAIWAVGVIAAVGAAVKWALEIRTDLHKGP